jgi:hypothetical protein
MASRSALITAERALQTAMSAKVRESTKITGLFVLSRTFDRGALT